MYAVFEDVVKVGFIAAVILSMAALSWWFLLDSDGTVGGVEID